MTREIVNQYNNHIIDEHIRDEIDFALEHDMTHTYFQGSKIEIEKDFKDEDRHVTVVNVRGI